MQLRKLCDLAILNQFLFIDNDIYANTKDKSVQVTERNLSISLHFLYLLSLHSRTCIFQYWSALVCVNFPFVFVRLLVLPGHISPLCWPLVYLRYRYQSPWALGRFLSIILERSDSNNPPILYNALVIYCACSLTTC